MCLHTEAISAIEQKGSGLQDQVCVPWQNSKSTVCCLHRLVLNLLTSKKKILLPELTGEVILYTVIIPVVLPELAVTHILTMYIPLWGGREMTPNCTKLSSARSPPSLPPYPLLGTLQIHHLPQTGSAPSWWVSLTHRCQWCSCWPSSLASSAHFRILFDYGIRERRSHYIIAGTGIRDGTGLEHASISSIQRTRMLD